MEEASDDGALDEPTDEPDPEGVALPEPDEPELSELEGAALEPVSGVDEAEGSADELGA